MPEIVPVRGPSLPEISPPPSPGGFVQTPASASLDPDAPTATRPKVLAARRGPAPGVVVVAALVALLVAAVAVGLVFAR